MGLRDDQRAVLPDKEDVGTTGLLDEAARLRVEKQIVRVSISMRLNGGKQAHGIVETGLDVAGAMWRRAVVLGDLQLDRLDTARVVRADGRHEDAELVLVRGPDADNVARGDHERSDIERGARAKGRHPGGVGTNDLLDRLDETLTGKRRHNETLCRVVHTLGILVRPEADDVTVLGGVGLETLEDLLAVVEDASTLREPETVVRRQRTLIPGAILVVGHIAIVSRLIGKAEVTPVEILLIHMIPLRESRALPGEREDVCPRTIHIRLSSVAPCTKTSTAETRSKHRAHATSTHGHTTGNARRSRQG